MGNLFSLIPESMDDEICDQLLKSDTIRIERILSKGHATAENEWYDQDENEWVMVVKGAGEIIFEDGSTVPLKAGDYLNIPAHKKHRVLWTNPDEVTVWLAVFYR